jgi:hypothetical protein
MKNSSSQGHLVATIVETILIFCSGLSIITSRPHSVVREKYRRHNHSDDKRTRIDEKKLRDFIDVAAQLGNEN